MVNCLQGKNHRAECHGANLLISWVLVSRAVEQYHREKKQGAQIVPKATLDLPRHTQELHPVEVAY